MVNVNMKIALTGDFISTKNIFHKVKPFIDTYRLIKSADIAFTNLEVPLHDFKIHPIKKEGSLYFRGPPSTVKTLNKMGFNAISLANNHIGDYSLKGMMQTINLLEENELPSAGLGENLTSARSPEFIETPNGIVALIAATSTYIPSTVASNSNQNIPGRPGVSPLKLNTRYIVPENHFNNLKNICELFNFNELISSTGRDKYLNINNNSINFLDVGSGTAGKTTQFIKGDNPKIERYTERECVKNILNQIKWANKQADIVIMSLHCHEGEDGKYSDNTVPKFLKNFAHNCIKAGSDIFVGHGPHQIRSIEIYNNKPIFYSLGNFISQQDSIYAFPAEAYEKCNLTKDSTPADLYEKIGEDKDEFDIFDEQIRSDSIIPICDIKNGEINKIELYPIELGYYTDNQYRGMPRLAKDKDLSRIYEHVNKLSSKCETNIIKDKIEEKFMINL